MLLDQDSKPASLGFSYHRLLWLWICRPTTERRHLCLEPVAHRPRLSCKFCPIYWDFPYWRFDNQTISFGNFYWTSRFPFRVRFGVPQRTVLGPLTHIPHTTYYFISIGAMLIKLVRSPLCE